MRMKRVIHVVSVLAAASLGGCEKSKPSSEEAPIKPGSTINRPPPPPIDAAAPVDAAEALTPVVDGDAGAAAAEPPGGSAVAPGATDEVRPPVAADLATYTAGIPGKGKLMAAIVTSMGTFNCELYEDVPMTVANFVGLATGKKPWKDPNKNDEVQKNRPFFNGIIFHRVIPQFMVQVGDPLGQGVGGPGYNFDNEIVAKYKHDSGGILSMANAGPGTNGSQFFITEVATPWLDGKHTIFGKCKEVDLVKKITGVERDGSDKPKTPITIKNVKFSRK